MIIYYLPCFFQLFHLTISGSTFLSQPPSPTVKNRSYKTQTAVLFQSSRHKLFDLRRRQRGLLFNYKVQKMQLRKCKMSLVTLHLIRHVYLTPSPFISEDKRISVLQCVLYHSSLMSLASHYSFSSLNVALLACCIASLIPLTPYLTGDICTLALSCQEITLSSYAADNVYYHFRDDLQQMTAVQQEATAAPNPFSNLNLLN